jgi:Icc protein
LLTSRTSFESLPFDSSRTVTWIHIGDPHLKQAEDQNAIDLGRIVDEINEVYAHGGVDFVYIPGDIADDGSMAAYQVFRAHLDRLKLPWFGIIGDHDVHEMSFANFQTSIDHSLYSSFSIGAYRFFRLNAFSSPRPDAFLMDGEQLTWLEAELKQCEVRGDKAVLFLHCYPSDLKQGGAELAKLLRQYPVLLVDMGHTHYNEISNDGTVLYTATRSTGQIEEGPVGYSVTTLDERTVSWHFVELGSQGMVAITSPSDERLLTRRTAPYQNAPGVRIRARIWSRKRIKDVRVQMGGRSVPLARESGVSWSCAIDMENFKGGAHLIEVIATGETMQTFSSCISLRSGPLDTSESVATDQQNAIGEWKERGILGTQLGPNKNGRKW